MSIIPAALIVRSARRGSSTRGADSFNDTIAHVDAAVCDAAATIHRQDNVGMVDQERGHPAIYLPNGSTPRTSALLL